MTELLCAARIKPRIKAFGIQVAIALVWLVPLFYFVRVEWYPYDLFAMVGGLQGLYILLGVYVVVGPVLTFLAYDVAKSRGKNRFDLTVIGILQTAALIWGIYTVHAQRPVALVFDEDRFISVTAAPIATQKLTPSELASRFATSQPPTVYSLPPRDKDDFAAAFLRTLNEGLALPEMVDRMRPLSEHLQDLSKHALDPSDQGVTELLRNAAEALAASGASAALVQVYRFSGRYSDGYVVLDQTGRLLGVFKG